MLVAFFATAVLGQSTCTVTAILQKPWTDLPQCAKNYCTANYAKYYIAYAQKVETITKTPNVKTGMTAITRTTTYEVNLKLLTVQNQNPPFNSGTWLKFNDACTTHDVVTTYCNPVH